MTPARQDPSSAIGARFFRTPAAFHQWLARHHETEAELVVGFNKVGSGKGGITYGDALDEALCVGWIDAVRRRIDDERYSILFTRRKARSIWTAVNITRVNELIADGRMQPTGLAAFEKREAARSAIYSYERGGAVLEGEMLAQFQAEADGWAFYEQQAPWYRRTSAFWVLRAKKPETRVRRLETLIAKSKRGERLDSLTPTKPAR